MKPTLLILRHTTHPKQLTSPPTHGGLNVVQPHWDRGHSVRIPPHRRNACQFAPPTSQPPFPNHRQAIHLNENPALILRCLGVKSAYYSLK